MSKYVFFDLETTGLRRDSEILEFGALVFDENFHLIDVINQYYSCDDVPAGATAIHGLTPIKLQMYNAVDWDRHAHDAYSVFEDPDIYICGHNVSGYDIPVLQTNLELSGITWKPNTDRIIDTMKLYGSRYDGSKKLSAATETAAAALGITIRDIEMLFKNSPMIAAKIVDKTAYFHNALFDSYCSFVVYSTLLR